MRWWLVVLGLAVLLGGCSRAYYRRDADRETYAAVHEHMDDPRWVSPRTSIDAPPESRLHDPFDPDRPPLPPDDPAAFRWMQGADGHLWCHRWDADGIADTVEDPRWQASLALEPDGSLQLTPERAVELGLLHSRAYQRAVEDLYLNALSLTLNRFEFDLHWFLRNATFYDHFGSSSVPGESNTLSTGTGAGFTKAFASGGELLVSFANSFVWQYTGRDSNTVSSNFLISFVQPLLRQAGRRVRLESLTQAERSLLYAVRDFARFRKEFSVSLTTGGGGYLSLLLQVQNIRNLEENLASLEQNLRVHEALFLLGNVRGIQIDQAFQDYQNGRLALLRAETGLAEALDRYKITLGLPPTIPIKKENLDDFLLTPFQLVDPGLEKLQGNLEKLHATWRQPEAAPPADKLREGYRDLLAFHEQTLKFRTQVAGELGRWQQLPAEPDETEPKLLREQNLRRQREKRAKEGLALQLAALDKDLEDLSKAIVQGRDGVQENNRPKAWEDLQKRIRQEIDAAADVFVIQNQVRVYLIRLTPVKLDLSDAIQYALEERLDLMNQRARVVDAWRKIGVAANALKSDLDVRVEANIGTEADASNPFEFAASASRYRVGFEFDGPLNRQFERNIYRATLVTYQRSRREFMAGEDEIRQAIRRDLRNLETERLNFEIARQSLIAAARQVESAREGLLIAEAGQDTSPTQNVLNAINALLSAKSGLIGAWVSYQTLRVQLLLDLEALQLDERGLYSHEHDIDLRRDRFGPVAQPQPQPGGP